MKGKQPDDTSHVLPHSVLEVGSMVQFGNPVQYGVIKDFKNDSYNKCAVLETVSIYIIIIIHMHAQPSHHILCRCYITTVAWPMLPSDFCLVSLYFYYRMQISIRTSLLFS